MNLNYSYVGHSELYKYVTVMNHDCFWQVYVAIARTHLANSPLLIKYILYTSLAISYIQCTVTMERRKSLKLAKGL